MNELRKQSKRVDRAISRMLVAKREAQFFLNHTDLSTFEISERLGIKEEDIERSI